MFNENNFYWYKGKYINPLVKKYLNELNSLSDEKLEELLDTYIENKDMTLMKILL